MLELRRGFSTLVLFIFSINVLYIGIRNCGSTPKMFLFVIYIGIRECGSTLHVGLAHAVPFTQYIASTCFSPNWLTEGSTLIYICKDEQISCQG